MLTFLCTLSACFASLQTFAKLDTEELPDLTMKLNIGSLPAFRFYKVRYNAVQFNNSLYPTLFRF